MEEPKNHNLLFRFLNRETSETENNEVFQWVSASEENRTEFRRFHQVYLLSDLRQFQSEIDVDKAWDKLSSQIQEAKGKPKVIYLNVFRKVAVSVLIALAVGFGALWTNDHFFNKTEDALVQFEAPAGEKSKIILADGSHVWLNSQTVLKYNALHPRKVNLEGEAYFEVKKDPAHPFEITTISGMKVKVTGTRFNLRSFSSEPFVETTLDEGEVVISRKKSDHLTILKPGQQAQYNISSNEIQVQNVSTEIFSIWKNNELRFNDISFAELVPRIERWYGVTIELDPNISGKDRFTMTIKTESLRELLNMMKLTTKFNYEINGEKVELFAK